ncbi:unnamed protein product [Allacma fusca]|uniref:G-protein coupled receptors family 2 profile 2 domain-containing protein n=1 Tax=Allacma fusca TaxID=39272 RepID=A0A8J2K4D3_9HEXA|nr:unnamed protein product [Allacma fusca]
MATLKPTRMHFIQTAIVFRSNITMDEIQVQTCNPNCDDTASGFACVTKCCPFGRILTADLETDSGFPVCTYPIQTDQFHDWSPSFYNRSLLKVHYNVFNIWQHCEFSTAVLTPNERGRPFKYARIRLHQDGSVQTQVSGNHKWETRTTVDTYCVDAFESEHADDDFDEDDLAVLICTRNKPREPADYIYFPVLVVSSIFAASTVVVYLLIWDTQNLHGWTVATFASCSFAFLALTAIEHAVGLWRGISFGTTVCKIFAIGGHFFYVGMFAWSTVLAFDLWSAVRMMGPINRVKQGFTQWLFYASFGFGAPAVVVGIGYGIESFYDEMDDTVYRPQYGRTRCGLDSSSIIYYTLFPCLILYILNIIIAAMMGSTLWKFRQVRNTVKSGAGNRKSTATLYVKLFILMGLSWGFEFISYLDKSNSWIWICFDVLNLLQAVGVFIIFVCKAEVKQQLSKKYGLFRACFGLVGQNLGKPQPTERSISLRATYLESRMSHRNTAYS